MNEKNKKRQIEEKRRAQKKLLTQMQKEIKNLEFEIKYSKLINLKINVIKNLKISGRALQLIAPYLVTLGIGAGVFKNLGVTPFYRDDIKAYANIMTEFDNIGNIRTEEQYGDFEGKNGKLYCYGKWEKDDNGEYFRMIQMYSIKKETYETMMELFNQDELKLEDIFGNPDSQIKETKNNLTKEELEQEPFLKAIVYNKDKDNYVIYKETIRSNITSTLVYLTISFFIGLLIAMVREDCSTFSFSNCVDDIKRKHTTIDIELLTKKLEIKKDNYNRLMR